MTFVENKKASGLLGLDLITRMDKYGNPRCEAAYTADGIAVIKRLVISVKYSDLDLIPASLEDKNYPLKFAVKARFNFDEIDPSK